MDDLVTRLLAAIAEADDVREDDPSGHCDELEGRHYMADEVHRRCAADRKIVAEARGLSDGVLKDDPVAALGDLVLTLLAEGYGITEEDAQHV